MTTWLRPEHVLVRHPARTLPEVLDAVADAVSRTVRLEREALRRLLVDATRTAGFSLGAGVAVPHVDVPGLAETVVGVVTTAAPVKADTLDGRPVDVFLVVLSKEHDPRGHLLLLAHLARLAQSRVLVDGMRQAATADDVVALIAAAELRVGPGVFPAAHAPAPQNGDCVALLSIAGERTVDDLLVALLDQGFHDATLVEAQTVREAATREVAVFAGFHDIFGDPGGRRLIVVSVRGEEVEPLADTVRRICQERPPEHAELLVVPVRFAWRFTPEAPAAGPRGGH